MTRIPTDEEVAAAAIAYYNDNKWLSEVEVPARAFPYQRELGWAELHEMARDTLRARMRAAITAAYAVYRGKEGARIRELEAALKPFAESFADMSGPTLEDRRRAQTAMEPKTGGDAS